MNIRNLFLSVCLVLVLGTVAQGARPTAANPNGGAFTYLPLVTNGTAQDDNANEWVPTYTGQFQYGLNPGYYGSNWSDEAIYQLCYDAGCRTARNTLPDYFLAQWGTGIRVNTFNHIYNDLQFRQITTFLQGPRDEWRSTEVFDGQQSELWQGMYEPIWDNGENGTPVNDANRFAVYVWQVTSTYGDFIDFYEIINEPDYTYSSHGWEDAGQPGSWWVNPPQPGDMPNLNAPIYHYIRLLRIAYAVVKEYDPTAYVTPGGLGYPSYLDALLRYTDNPNGGQVTAAYPLTGGAYFDALSIHNYPQFGTRYYENGQWHPDRHSDKAVEVFLDSRAAFEKVLFDRGYDGQTYPQKPIIITEMNVARRQIDETLGGEVLQRNFTIKALVKAQQADIKQIYWFTTGETKNYDDPTATAFSLMGFYENLYRDTPGNQIITQQGIANRTTFQQLFGWNYDEAATVALNLPTTVDGAAFRQGNQFRYVLWAKTTQDNSETAVATINLPGSYTQVNWDGSSQQVSGTNLQLTGTPIFLTQN
ncbi:MAG: hypothetical protein H6652_18425 [Ardenticatenaceae bacterium]|nr:hypothetical protein [Ardenticatenaceae bacterium]